MSRFSMVTGLLVAGLVGCSGPTGPAGPAGPAGSIGATGSSGASGSGCTVVDNGDGTKTISCDDGTTATVADGTVDPTTLNNLQSQIDALDQVQPESCATCHNGAGMGNHQSVYDQFTDASKLKLSIDSVQSTDNGDGTFDTTMFFSITKNGQPFLDGDGLPSLDQKTFYTVQFDSATQTYDDAVAFSNPVSLGGGNYQVTATGLDYAPESTNAQAYGYITQGKLPLASHGHITLYDNVSNAARAYGHAAAGDTGAYDSVANVAACEQCHGSPYMKHGYRAAVVDGIPDFAACKTCHYDTRAGHDQAWQMMANDPARYAQIYFGDTMTTAEQTQYAYTANLMNDVHMSHSMEFPYPQSMANCATCHAGKLARVLTDANFRLATCKSCHPVTGSDTYGTSQYALETLWTNAGVLSSHEPYLTANPPTQCGMCHNGSAAKSFSQIHSGYNPSIYADANGTRYSDLFKMYIDSASLDSNDILTVDFHAEQDTANTPASFTLTPADIIPTVLIGLYGYNTKDFIVSPHSTDANGDRLLEYQVDGTTTNPRFTTVSASNGSWEITADLSQWAGMIADGSVKRAEIAVMPWLGVIVGQKDSHENGETNDTVYALNAPSETFDLITNSFDNSFYSDIVDVQGCNSCHDALGTTFHTPDRGGNIRVCRLCHVTSSGASHLEMQSRSIDSYVHAIHSFQAFNPDSVDFTDAVQKMRYDMHTQDDVYPDFTLANCESCHLPGTYEVPDQSKSLPGVLSASKTLNEDRNIGTVPSVVDGPGARACGSCHRSHLINTDDAGGLVAFDQHTKANGYAVPAASGVWDTVVKAIMSLFQ